MESKSRVGLPAYNEKNNTAILSGIPVLGNYQKHTVHTYKSKYIKTYKDSLNIVLFDPTRVYYTVDFSVAMVKYECILASGRNRTCRHKKKDKPQMDDTQKRVPNKKHKLFCIY